MYYFSAKELHILHFATYSPIKSTLMLASSNNGCTCSVYILRPNFLPPIGLIKTSNLLGLLKPA